MLEFCRDVVHIIINYFLLFILRYLQCDFSDVLTSLDGPKLDSDLRNYEEILRSNRQSLFNHHFIDGEKRPDVNIQTLYVTAEDRAVAEDIRNSSKDEIIRRISEKLRLISSEEIRGPLSGKLDSFEANPSQSKKETLLMFYNEIVEELQQSRDWMRC